VSAPARLLALRLQGFKSFAEKTVVEFGPGISAVVGPNGSGKSTLAIGTALALAQALRQQPVSRELPPALSRSEQAQWPKVFRRPCPALVP